MKDLKENEPKCGRNQNIGFSTLKIGRKLAIVGFNDLKL